MSNHVSTVPQTATSCDRQPIHFSEADIITARIEALEDQGLDVPESLIARLARAVED